MSFLEDDFVQLSLEDSKAAEMSPGVSREPGCPEAGHGADAVWYQGYQTVRCGSPCVHPCGVRRTGQGSVNGKSFQVFWMRCGKGRAAQPPCTSSAAGGTFTQSLGVCHCFPRCSRIREGIKARRISSEEDTGRSWTCVLPFHKMRKTRGQSER